MIVLVFGFFLGILYGLYIHQYLKSKIIDLIDYVLTTPSRNRFNSVIENNWSSKEKGDYPREEDV